MENESKTPAASDLASTLIDNTKPALHELKRGDEKEAAVIVYPDGMKVESIKKHLDEYKERPDRRTGTIKLTRSKSFIEVVNRFKSKESVLFAKVSVASTSITANIKAIFDYHPASDNTDDADNCGHKAEFDFPLSAHFMRWLGQNGNLMSQSDFAFFLESRIADIAAANDEDVAKIKALKPTFADSMDMLELARSLEIYSNEAVVQSIKTSSGEKEIKFTSEHVDADGKPVKIPDFFVINLPLFEGGAPQRILTHLRYRKDGNGVKWAYELYNVDEMLSEGFELDCENIQKEVDLPLYFGTAE